jgi:hypothetical protein
MTLTETQLAQLKKHKIDPTTATVDDCIAVILKLDSDLRKLGISTASSAHRGTPNRGEPNRGKPRP